jgi:hypothetical protein
MMRDVKDEIDCKLASESRGVKGLTVGCGFQAIHEKSKSIKYHEITKTHMIVRKWYSKPFLIHHWTTASD